MKKKHKKHLLLWAALGAASGVAGYLLGRRRRKQNLIRKIEDARDVITPPEGERVDYHDSKHLIFSPETQLNRRFILPDKTINFRDIGGYTGKDGRKVKWGKVFRSEATFDWDDDVIAYLEDKHLRHVYDFRGTDNANRQRDRVPDGADYLNLNVLRDFPYSASAIDFDDPNGVDTFFKHVYAFLVEHRAQDFAVVLHALAKDETPILFHCTNGKDRTGIMAALILLICGVPEETVLSDYTLTNVTFDRAFDTLGTIMATGMNKNDPAEKAKIRDFFGVRPEWMQIVLGFIDDRYESVDDYLLDRTDLTKDELDAIRDNLLEK